MTQFFIDNSFDYFELRINKQIFKDKDSDFQIKSKTMPANVKKFWRIFIIGIVIAVLASLKKVFENTER